MIIRTKEVKNSLHKLYTHLCSCAQNAKSGPAKILGDSLRAHPNNIFPDLDDAKKKIMTGLYAFPFVKINSNL